MAPGEHFEKAMEKGALRAVSAVKVLEVTDKAREELRKKRGTLALSKFKRDRVDVQAITVVEVGDLMTVFQPPQGSRVGVFDPTSSRLLHRNVELSSAQLARWQELVDQSSAKNAVEATLCADVAVFLNDVIGIQLKDQTTRSWKAYSYAGKGQPGDLTCDDTIQEWKTKASGLVPTELLELDVDREPFPYPHSVVEGVKSTDGCYKLKNTPFLQLFAEADAWLWEGGHRTRVVVLTDMVDWWFGVHHLATYEDEDGTKRWRNRFQVADRPLREPTAVLSTWLRLREWVKHIDRSMEKTPAGVCLACNGNPSIHRPAISYLTEEQIEAEAKAVGRAHVQSMMTDIFRPLSPPTSIEELKSRRDAVALPRHMDISTLVHTEMGRLQSLSLELGLIRG